MEKHQKPLFTLELVGNHNILFQSRVKMTSLCHSAAGANAGFNYQFERAFYWLAQSPAGAAIGIETSDDVAVRDVDGTLILEQDKHSIRDGAEPFGDRSKDLWNTLMIWINAVESKQVEIETTTFLLVTNKVLSDCIAKSIGNAKTSADAAKCIAALKSAAKNPPQTIASIVARVLDVNSQPILNALIVRVELADGTTASAGPELRQATIGHLQLPGWCDTHSQSIADELLGWLHKITLKLWREKQPAWILRDHFVNQMHAILDRRKRQSQRERAEYLIPITPEKVGEERGRPFVKQLHLVSEDEAIVDTSIQDFIRCNIEKIRLSK
ncbi:MAG TPA: hypothetical protein VMF06_15810, partial [Candidatus Limnocylindria bacterium]|nr:hypothetical protein [Candidatus Limnocylindria bacterium]